MSIHDSYSSNFLLSFTSSSKYPEIDGEQSAIGTYGKKDIFFATIDISGSIDNVYALGGTEDDEITDAIVTFDGLITLCGGFASSDLYFGNLLKLSSAPGATSAIIASKFKFDPQKNPDVCDKNLVKNGGFENRNLSGPFATDFPKYWTAMAKTSPTIVSTKEGIADVFMELYGSLDKGEGIHQTITFKKGIEYQISFDAKYEKASDDNAVPRIRFIASNFLLSKTTDVISKTSIDSGCIIGESVKLSEIEWQPRSIPNWKAINNYKYLTIVVTSDRIDVDSGYVIGLIDNICIREVIKCPTVTTAPVDKLCCSTNFTLNSDPLYPITSIGYTITGGTVKSMTTSPCISTGSISVGSSNGKLLFSTPCNKPLNVEFYGIPTSASGNMALNLDIAMGSKGTCMVSIPISCAVPGIKFKDKVSVTPGHLK
ncbi:MAG: hypothetical protein IPM69_14240 [Ignavibacteria bacterium]|nr:hypothetical protein [Ignavibacteria bacterium]